MRVPILRLFEIAIVQHVRLTDGTGDVGVCENVDEAGSGEDSEVEELVGRKGDCGGGGAVVGVDETWVVCACGGLRHDACFQ